MKSYYSIMLVTIFAFVMSIMAIVKTAIVRQDLSPADAAVVVLAIGVALLAYRLSQAEKRIAHLENQIEEKNDKQKKQNKISNITPIK